jgi:hypothetical protein
METAQSYWKKCGPCKKEIYPGMNYFRCSISACNNQAFCSQSCFRVHSEMMRHRDAFPDEAIAPAVVATEQVRRKVEASTPAAKSPTETKPAAGDEETDILVVMSKLKHFVRQHSGLNTSAGVAEALSDIVRQHCRHAMEKAQQAGRKTLMDRDFT